MEYPSQLEHEFGWILLILSLLTDSTETFAGDIIRWEKNTLE